MIKATIYFRADGGKNIGLGHLVRSMALAQMLSAHFNIVFCSVEAPGSLKDEMYKLGFECIEINNEAAFTNLLSAKDIAVLDGYHFNIQLQQEIVKTGCKLVCIDDLYEQHFVADLIINHAPGVLPADYSALPGTAYALGLEYVLLRPPFLTAAKQRRETSALKNVLICFGGSDVKQITEEVLKVLKDYKVFEKIFVITGAAYTFSASFSQLVAADTRVEHHHDINENDMCRLMMLSDLCIVPSSSILLEAMATGLHIISSKYVDNQKLFYERLKQQQAFIDAGDFSHQAINGAISKAIAKKTSSRQLIDGYSPQRLLECFIQLQICLRPAAVEDTALFFNWANEPAVRANAIHTEPIIWEQHVAWFQKKIKEDDAIVYVMEYMGTAVGQIRLDKDEEGFWVIDYSIDKEYRGYRFGKKIIEMALKILPGKKIKAMVKESNLPSKKVFNALNFAHSKVAMENGDTLHCFLFNT